MFSTKKKKKANRSNLISENEEICVYEAPGASQREVKAQHCHTQVSVYHEIRLYKTQSVLGISYVPGTKINFSYI